MKTETKPKPKLPKIPAAPDSRAPALAVEAWPVDRPKPYARNAFRLLLLKFLSICLSAYIR